MCLITSPTSWERRPRNWIVSSSSVRRLVDLGRFSSARMTRDILSRVVFPGLMASPARLKMRRHWELVHRCGCRAALSTDAGDFYDIHHHSPPRRCKTVDIQLVM